MLKKLGVVAASLVLLVGLAACKNSVTQLIETKNEAKDDPVAFVAAAMSADTNIKSATTKMTMNVVMSDAASDLSYSMAMDMTGKSDEADLTNPKMDLTMNLSLDMGAEGDLEISNVQIRTLDQIAYFNIGDIDSSMADFDSVKTLIAPFTGVWYYADPEDPELAAMFTGLAAEAVPLPVDADIPMDGSALDTEALTQDLQELMDSVSLDSSVFTGLAYEGEETLNGIKVYKISFDGFDGEKLYEILTEVMGVLSPDMATDMSAADKRDFLDGLEQLTMGGTMYFGSEDKYLYKLMLDMTMTPEDADAEVVMDMTIEYTDLNKAVTVTRPESPKNVMEVINALSAMGMSGADESYLDDTLTNDVLTDDYADLTDEEWEQLMQSYTDMGL